MLQYKTRSEKMYNKIFYWSRFIVTVLTPDGACEAAQEALIRGAHEADRVCIVYRYMYTLALA